MKNIFGFTGEFENEDKIILRDYLALERTRLANERTLFSYIRTSLYLLTVGVGVLQIDSVIHLETLAWLCILIGIAIFCIGVLRFLQLKKQLKSYMMQKNSRTKEKEILLT